MAGTGMVSNVSLKNKMVSLSPEEYLSEPESVDQLRELVRYQEVRLSCVTSRLLKAIEQEQEMERKYAPTNFKSNNS